MIDEFTPIYRALARPTKDHRGFSPAEVDAMDITVCAVLMGVGMNPMADELAQLRELKRRRDAGEDVSWEDIG